MALSYKYQAEKEMKALGAKASAAITASAHGMRVVAINRTPRDTGTAQAGWKLSNKRRGSYIPTRRVQPRPGRSNFRFRITKDRAFYFWNNVTYISYLNDGTARMKAHNMLLHAKAFFESDLRRRLSLIP